MVDNVDVKMYKIGRMKMNENESIKKVETKVSWNELIENLKSDIIDKVGDADPIVNDIVYDSRKVKQGTVFVAVPGLKVHGDSFIEQAIKDGAVAVVSENRQKDLSVPYIVVKDARSAIGILGKKLFNIDLSAIKKVGVTGTNGKTTTVSLYKNLFDTVYGEEYSWMFGTVENKLGKNVVEATHTTPESIDIFRYIGNCENRNYENKPKALAMEVSSHSLALSRVAGLEFDIAVWTNLTQDHLDFHKTFEEYYSAKKLLFTKHLTIGGVGVINIDDEYGKRLARELSSDTKKITYGKNEESNVRIVDWHCGFGGTSVEIVFNNEVMNFKSALCGYFNIYNITAMIAGAFALGIDNNKIAESLSSMKTVAGRMDKVEIDAPYNVIVDYAHTPDALVNVLKTSAELTSGRLICVFGCGGDRDKTKRPLMGKAVCENCDAAIVTSDNPRSEKPQRIIDDIVRGMPLDFPTVAIVDRAEAIKHALANARENDCIVVAGKGHETYQEVNGVKHHFDDKEIIVKLYNEMKSEK